MTTRQISSSIYGLSLINVMVKRLLMKILMVTELTLVKRRLCS